MFKHLLMVLLLVPACRREAELVRLPFEDNFDRPALGPHWAEIAPWRIEDGALVAERAKNRPLWLKLALPDDVTIEFDARSLSPKGDLKCELFGDGVQHASGYIVIYGGWKNTISTIARLDEHGRDRQELHQKGVVEAGRTYRWKLIRKGHALRWFVDGKQILDFYDPEPLRGRGHDRFAFNDWEIPVWFDNLRITAAE